MRDKSRVMKLFWPFIIFVATMLLIAHTSTDFLHFRDGAFYGSFVDVFNRGARVMLISLGMTLVIATGGVDLSVGAVMAIAGAVAASLIKHTGMSIGAVIAIAMFAGALCGVWNGVLAAYFDIQPMIATLILMVAGRGVAQLITDGQILTFSDPTFAKLAAGHVAGVPVPIVLVVVGLIVIGALTNFTPLRLYLESCGNNAVASRCAGVPVARAKMMAYIICGLCSALAGLVETSDIAGADVNNLGLYFEMDAILAVVIGGTAMVGGRFSLVGAVLGAVTIQALTTVVLTKGVDPNVTRVVKALVVVVVCLLQSEVFRERVQRRFARLKAAMGGGTKGGRK